jgi:hypothetical protein
VVLAGCSWKRYSQSQYTDHMSLHLLLAVFFNTIYLGRIPPLRIWPGMTILMGLTDERSQHPLIVPAQDAHGRVRHDYIGPTSERGFSGQ